MKILAPSSEHLLRLLQLDPDPTLVWWMRLGCTYGCVAPQSTVPGGSWGPAGGVGGGVLMNQCGPIFTLRKNSVLGADYPGKMEIAIY